jgi:chaperonin cofactor prefoldin
MKIKIVVKTLELEWPTGKKDLITIPIGSVEMIEAWLNEAKELKDMVEKVDESTKVSELYSLMGSCISKLIGPKVWQTIDKKAERNLFAVTQVLKEITRLATEGMSEAQKLAS